MTRMTRVLLAFSVLAGTLSAQTTTLPPLQKGVRVQMAATDSAQPMVEADAPTAWIVSVTFDGSYYFGIDPVPRAGLLDALTRRPRDRDQKLYIKADARAPFAAVKTVMDTAREALFESTVLLTSQPQPVTPGRPVPPTGLEVWMNAVTSEDSPVVQVVHARHPPAAITINRQSISAGVLTTTLDQLLAIQKDKTVVLKADPQLPVAQVVAVIDACHAAGAKLVLGKLEL